MQSKKTIELQNHDSDDLGVVSIIHQLLARKSTIFLVSFFFGVLGFIYAQLNENVYTATSVVQIEKRPSNIALPAELVGEMFGGIEQSSELESEFHVIKSRLTLGQVVRDNDLQLRIKPTGPRYSKTFFYRTVAVFERYGLMRFLERIMPEEYARSADELEIEVIERFFLRDDFEAQIITTGFGGYRVEYINADTGQSETKDGYVGEELIIDGWSRFIVKKVPERSGVKFQVFEIPVRSAARELAKNLKISERGGRSGTGVVDFEVMSNDPSESILIVNAIVKEYQRQSLGRRSAEVEQSINFIEQQLPIADDNLEQALKAFNSYIETTGAYATLSATTQEMLARVVEFERELEEISFQKSQLEMQVTESHPDFLRLKAREAELLDRLNILRAEMESVPETEQRLAELTKNVQSSRELKEQLLLRLDQLRIVRASAVGTIRVLEQAEDASLSGPNRLAPVGVGIVAGLIVASFVIIVRNSLQKGIEDEKEIDEIGLSVFATIPLVQDLKNSGAKDANYALANTQPENLAVEALRAVRTGLHFTLSARNAKSILITSPAPNEGKSFISLNLSIVAAKAGAKVLLVDSDLRRGELYKTFRLQKRSRGLSNYLAGQSELNEIIHKSETLGIDFVSTGGYPPNPSELLSSKKFEEMVAKLEAMYDLVIFDCAPVLAVTDPVIVSSFGMPTFLVVTHLRTCIEEIEASVKALESVDSKISGVILNSYDQSRSRYGSYSTRYGYYRSGYRYQYKSK